MMRLTNKYGSNNCCSVVSMYNYVVPRLCLCVYVMSCHMCCGRCRPNEFVESRLTTHFLVIAAPSPLLSNIIIIIIITIVIIGIMCQTNGHNRLVLDKSGVFILSAR